MNLPGLLVSLILMSFQLRITSSQFPKLSVNQLLLFLTEAYPNLRRLSRNSYQWYDLTKNLSKTVLNKAVAFQGFRLGINGKPLHKYWILPSPKGELEGSSIWLLANYSVFLLEVRDHSLSSIAYRNESLHSLRNQIC